MNARAVKVAPITPAIAPVQRAMWPRREFFDDSLWLELLNVPLRRARLPDPSMLVPLTFLTSYRGIPGALSTARGTVNSLLESIYLVPSLVMRKLGQGIRADRVTAPYWMRGKPRFGSEWMSHDYLVQIAAN